MQPEPVPPEITHSVCPRCHADIDGLNGRYACTLCGWVNHWSEGQGELPAPDGHLPEPPPEPGRQPPA
ncbi:hypothetical protein ACFYVL_31665 [Streptomyces sp. NPDC004111]|uniref:hypothetical protein n=1 Tax=Streptomyces sp. NPDC004111 TaxID=3364690 RepID=UPI0036AD57EB